MDMKKILLTFILLCFSSIVLAEDFYTGRGNAAIKGYDAVAYFKQGEAVKGSSEFSYDYKGVTWQFASAENLNDFKASPDNYIPQYGGYCAYAMSLYSKKVKIDPKQFTVKDDKLYLNYNAGTSRKFNTDIDNHISQADENWTKVATE